LGKVANGQTERNTQIDRQTTIT